MGLANLGDMLIQDAFRYGILPRSYTFPAGACPAISVDAYGNVLFSL